jgi:hypothetical protein
VKFAVVAEYGPTFSGDGRNPNVIRRGIWKTKFALGVVVVFNGKMSRMCAPDHFRKALPKAPVKIEDQWASD